MQIDLCAMEQDEGRGIFLPSSTMNSNSHLTLCIWPVGQGPLLPLSPHQTPPLALYVGLECLAHARAGPEKGMKMVRGLKQL